MASYPVTIFVPQAQSDAFARMASAAQKEGWLIIKSSSPGLVPPRLKLKAGRTQTFGCGRTEIRFPSSGSYGTAVSIKTCRALSDSLARLPALSLIEALELDPADYRLDPDSVALAERSEGHVVRFGVAAVIVLSVLAFFLIPLPTDSKNHQIPLPSVALGQPRLYHLEIALVVFYGALLILTPAFWGLIRGRLPNEISSRGAKYANEAEQANITERRLNAQKRNTDGLLRDFVQARVDIDGLAEDLKVSLKSQRPLKEASGKAVAEKN